MGLTDFLEKHRANKAKKQNKSSPAATRTSPSNENSIVLEKESHPSTDSSSSSHTTSNSSISSGSMSSKSSSMSSNDFFSSSSSNGSSIKSSEEAASGPRSKKIKKSTSQDANSSSANENDSKKQDLDDERSDANTSTNTTTDTSKQDQDNSEPNTKETSTAIVQKHPQEYLPKYLHRYVQHSHGDFFISPYFDPRLIATLMYEGFLPIATPNYLVPKLHKERCVIYPLHSSSGSTVHISKNVKKRSKKFTLTCNQSFRKVVQGCHDQHGISWLYPPIVDAFETILENTSLLEPHQTNTFPITFYTIEVWNLDGDLVGGELGYAFGTIYTSLTGFSKEDNAGSVQLAALGQFLWEQGFEMWDLGMELEYKQRLGARNMPRHEFVQTVKELRDKDTLVLKLDEPKCCKEMIVNASRSESGC
ncbi:leu phe-trna protein transferase [Chaetoceros tenuissimus]|uniref:Leu phe-trna protein transferase n=1 Tax=Chaetoceros tenuissimus TaxID=426638 RepID=A0AAD3H7E4_9STRA|nr:leu phe-trna protein transferase [Chaetoceros tenuissimus]